MPWLSVAAVLVGFALLLWGADRFVDGAAGLARSLGIAPLIIGLTIVGFGTSAPEMLVSATAAWAGSPGIAIGNAIGSNITNIGMVLGFTALLSPLSLHPALLRREFPVLLGISTLTLLLLADHELGRLDGIILLSGQALMIYWLVRLARRQQDCNPAQTACDDPLIATTDVAAGAATGNAPAISRARAAWWILLGLVILLLSSRLLVWGAVDIARFFGLPDLLIGLTIVAIGTSLPELAATLAGALKGEDDIAIGNILGSNMFNLLTVLGLPGLIHPLATPDEVIRRDYPIMLAFTILLFLFALLLRRRGRLGRLPGAILASGFIAYMVLLYRLNPAQFVHG